MDAKDRIRIRKANALFYQLIDDVQRVRFLKERVAELVSELKEMTCLSCTEYEKLIEDFLCQIQPDKK